MTEARVRIHCQCKQCETRFHAYRDEEIKCPQCGSTDYQVITE